MLTFNSPTLEDGVLKTTANARDLVETAITLQSIDTISNILGYGVLFMQTGLEEAAKASFLFEKYIKSLKKGYIGISNKEWSLWMGGRRSHSKRVARVQYLFALAEQVNARPGTPIIFPQGVEELLQNRNAALYVDFISEEMSFKSPSEMVDPNFLTGDPGFAQHLLHYTNYDVAVAYIKTAILNDRTKKSWFIKSIGREIERKKEDVLAKIVEYKKEFAVKNDTFERKVETIFCARLIPDELGLLYCCTVGTRDNSVFLMDENTNHFAIHPDGNIIHARFAGTIQEAPNIFRNEWEIIGSHQ